VQALVLCLAVLGVLMHSAHAVCAIFAACTFLLLLVVLHVYRMYTYGSCLHCNTSSGLPWAASRVVTTVTGAQEAFYRPVPVDVCTSHSLKQDSCPPYFGHWVRFGMFWPGSWSLTGPTKGYKLFLLLRCAVFAATASTCVHGFACTFALFILQGRKSPVHSTSWVSATYSIPCWPPVAAAAEGQHVHVGG
jgi:hypothetical protein